MGDIEAPENKRSRQTIVRLLPSKEFITSRKGLLLLGEVVMSFISFVCFAASTAAAFVTAPFIEFLAALFLLFAYSTKFNERFKGFHWPLMFFPNHHTCCFIKDFLRCVSASIILFIISMISVSKYLDGASKAAGVFGFITTIFFALDFYFIFNELANFLKGGDSSEEPPNTQDDDSDSDSG
ncbi:CKLF-like MARVEL transmembrane domain-containing protein 3 isoform X1 [Sinocyclocheilus grahami]|uniref:CKLF-like MARVEL transmembrane domain-containing protein 3 isoform X1 n=1 Tax=Sinocyclocheilus grahami TaxID=75366 RepID=UPI0007AD2D9B|nr:PREDICTED: CKLF-like MARVEL transmembrane domain-containing protein 3 isoform X1 [Sinocyclocheilus grahami]